jgi:hypothetical protein
MKKKLLAISVLAAISSQASAFQFDTGDDWQIRWDNTFKANVMARVNKPDDQVTQRAGGAWLAAQPDRSVDRSGLGLVSTRVDVLSEMDVIWKDNFGFRISGSAWYDPQYEEGNSDNDGHINANWATPSADVGDYSHNVEDLHYAGGELLDAFVFANFDIGDMALGVRAGRHTIYWGNSLLGNAAVSSIGGAMAPLDFSKSLSVPGSEAKELFMPTNKLSSVLQLTDNLTLNGYYSFEHRRYRLPADGSFFSPASGLTENTQFFPIPGILPTDQSVPSYLGRKGRNDQTETEEYGFNIQYYVERWNLETSFIYLNYVDKNLHGVLSGFDMGQFGTVLAAGGNETAAALMGAWNATCNGIPAAGIEAYPCPNLPYTMGNDGATVAGQHRWLFKEDNDLWGISFAKEMLDISWGLDLVYRPDHPVAPDLPANLGRIYNTPDSPLFPAGPDLAAALGLGYFPGDFNSYDSDNYLGPLGDVYTVVLNGLKLLNNQWGLWEGGSSIFEITAVMMKDCTKDCDLLDVRVNEDRVVTIVAGVFRPTWYQVFPGTDLTIPMSVAYTIDGEKSPFTFGGDEERGSASIGAELLIDQQWTFTAKYNTFFGPVNAGLGGLLKDRDNISMTLKRTF